MRRLILISVFVLSLLSGALAEGGDLFNHQSANLRMPATYAAKAETVTLTATATVSQDETKDNQGGLSGLFSQVQKIFFGIISRLNEEN